MKARESQNVVALPEASGSRKTDARSERPLDAVGAGIADLGEGDLTPRARRVVARLLREARGLHRELAQSRRRIDFLEQLADRDALVPALNRRAFLRELSRMTDFAERYGVAGSVLYFDINGLKQINDTYGHAAGDLALKHVARTLLQHLRASDVVGRLGGDEFGVILAQSDAAAALRKAASLAKAVSAEAVTCGEREIFVQVAYGVHALAAGEDGERSLDAADRAMYAHKNALRAGNRPSSGRRAAAARRG